MKNPDQPFVIEKSVIRFKSNKIIEDLYEFGVRNGFGLNEIAKGEYTQDDRNQFAQLIGYSVSGWSTLSYAIDPDETLNAAHEFWIGEKDV